MVTLLFFSIMNTTFYQTMEIMLTFEKHVINCNRTNIRSGAFTQEGDTKQKPWFGTLLAHCNTFILFFLIY